jgi:histidinol-phosphatase
MSGTPSIAADLELALQLADAADAISTGRFLADDLVVETKPDLTPVSEADKAAEVAIRELLATARPDDAVLGEEHGLTGGEANPRRWILDPIDGTKNFVRGLPTWGTLIGLQIDGTVEVGVVSAPALGRRWFAGRGLGARAEGRFAPDGPLRVSAVRDLSDACLLHSDYKLLLDLGFGPGIESAAKASWRTRGYGDFWMHMLVAEGGAEIAFDVDVKAWDLAPLAIIVEEAGGRFSDLAGRTSIDGGVGIATNGLVHDAFLAHFAQA